jgi:isopentenyl phosphate kinase
MLETETVFVKLGGSLITEKDQPYQVSEERLTASLKLIHELQRANPGLRILVGHGSGSFGHAAAKEHNFQQGLRNESLRKGFQKVWFAAHRLHHIVLSAGQELGLSFLSFPASSGATANNGQITAWSIEGIQTALSQDYLPLIYGDAVMDCALGGMILSTEVQFSYLVPYLKPKRIFLLGLEAGVYSDFPARQKIISKINANERLNDRIGPSEFTDVTGGMLDKVTKMQAICRQYPGLLVHILSGNEPDALVRAYAGCSIGTQISA